MFAFESAHRDDVIVPAVGHDMNALLEHRYRIRLIPKDVVSFQSQIDNPPHATLDGAAAQRQSGGAKSRILQPARFAVLRQIGDLGPNDWVVGRLVGLPDELVDDLPPVAIPQRRSLLAVER